MVVSDRALRWGLQSRGQFRRSAEGTHQEDALEGQPEGLHHRPGSQEKALQRAAVQAERSEGRCRRIQDQ